MATNIPMTETPKSDGQTAERTPTTGPALIQKLTAGEVQATFSALAQVNATSLEATGSALAMTNVDGNATVTASAAPLIFSKGDTTIQQSYTSAVIAGGGSFTRVRQSAAPLIVGKSMELEQVGAVALVTGEAKLKRSWTGIIVAPSVEISDDSRVLVDTKGALIIAAAILGGFGIIAAVMGIAFNRTARRFRGRMQLPGRLAQLPGQLTSQLQSSIKRLPENIADVSNISQAARRVRERIGV